MTGLNLTVEVMAESNDLRVSMEVLTKNMGFRLEVEGPESKLVGTIVFVALMVFCSYMSFSSILTILRAVLELQDNPRRYSFLTVMLTNMWDTVLCILCFIMAFKDQFSLMFFIIPAFLFCLLFTNLQPRFLMTIYHSTMDNDANFRQALCKFNLYHYGSLFAIYPILLFSNFNWVLFIGMSCIVFPQIYANGFSNVRPDVSSVYYTKYLFSRFVLIVNITACRPTLNVSLEISLCCSPIMCSREFVLPSSHCK
jgi:hypothetical protein